jgi:hypothetical protein
MGAWLTGQGPIQLATALVGQCIGAGCSTLESPWGAQVMAEVQQRFLLPLVTMATPCVSNSITIQQAHAVIGASVAEKIMQCLIEAQAAAPAQALVPGTQDAPLAQAPQAAAAQHQAVPPAQHPPAQRRSTRRSQRAAEQQGAPPPQQPTQQAAPTTGRRCTRQTPRAVAQEAAAGQAGTPARKRQEGQQRRAAPKRPRPAKHSRKAPPSPCNLSSAWQPTAEQSRHGLFCRGWEIAESILQERNEYWGGVFGSNMQVCGFCGQVALGMKGEQMITSVLAEGPNTVYGIANPLLHHKTVDGKGKQYVCNTCDDVDQRKKRSAHLAAHPAPYKQAVLSLDCLRVQLLSVLDASPYISTRVNGFLQGRMTEVGLLNQPLIALGEVPEWFGRLWAAGQREGEPAPLPQLEGDAADDKQCSDLLREHGDDVDALRQVMRASNQPDSFADIVIQRAGRHGRTQRELSDFDATEAAQRAVLDHIHESLLHTNPVVQKYSTLREQARGKMGYPVLPAEAGLVTTVLVTQLVSATHCRARPHAPSV